MSRVTIPFSLYAFLACKGKGFYAYKSVRSVMFPKVEISLTWAYKNTEYLKKPEVFEMKKHFKAKG
jgi:hypothetical protein